MTFLSEGGYNLICAGGFNLFLFLQSCLPFVHLEIMKGKFLLSIPFLAVVYFLPIPGDV